MDHVDFQEIFDDVKCKKTTKPSDEKYMWTDDIDARLRLFARPKIGSQLWPFVVLIAHKMVFFSGRVPKQLYSMLQFMEQVDPALEAIITYHFALQMTRRTLENEKADYGMHILIVFFFIFDKFLFVLKMSCSCINCFFLSVKLLFTNMKCIYVLSKLHNSFAKHVSER
jgi:hypothetical protein